MRCRDLVYLILTNVKVFGDATVAEVESSLTEAGLRREHVGGCLVFYDIRNNEQIESWLSINIIVLN